MESDVLGTSLTDVDAWRSARRERHRNDAEQSAYP
jgi:hypothetical protein